MARRLHFLLLAFFTVSGVQAQFTYVLDTAIAAQNGDGQTLAMPWGGGLNAGQYSTMDLDLDGKEDLVIYDRMADKVITFLNRNNQYHYAPQYESYFPAGITNWLLLRDFNCDGRKDIFTGDNLGMKVYTNVSEKEAGNTSKPKWEQYLFYSGEGNTKSQVLLTLGFSGLINLQLQFDDLPAIVDADGDGDLDIFTVQFVGNGTIEFHENVSNRCDSLSFKRITRTWGGITECSCGSFAFNNGPCPTRTEHAGGKSLLAIDANGDGQQDIMLSEATCQTMSLLANEGTLLSAVVNSSSLFPASRPVNLIIYPAGYYEDMDFDGVKDLIITPNVYLNNYFNSDFENSNWFYKNTGNNAAPAFGLIKTDFLQENMIDVGENAVPAFFDVDNDGDMDMLVSHFTSDMVSSRIRLFENTGTRSEPAFKLADNDFLGFSLSIYYNLKIRFADINNDGKQDFVFTATSTQSAATRLYYIANKSATGLDFSSQAIQQINFSLAASENLMLADISKDGLLDILAGRSDGALEYWRNTGPVANPSFTLENEKYLGIGSSVLRQNLACAAADLNADGKADLIMGDQTGELRIVSNYLEATSAADSVMEILFNPLLNDYETHNLGGRIWPTTVNLYDTDKPAIVVGNTLGGLAILKNDNGESLPSNPVIEIYPNPVGKTDYLNIRLDRAGTVQIFSVTGQSINQAGIINLEANETFALRVPNLAPGVYILRFIIRGRAFARRIVVY